jgi:hypothetical protein
MVEIKHEEWVRGHDNFVLALQCQQVYYMTYPCPRLSAWWVVYKVNPCELLPIPSASCYHACNLEDNSNLTIFSNLYIYKTNAILQTVATCVDPSDIDVFVDHYKGRDPANPD